MKILIVASLAESLINFRGPLLKAIVAAGHEVQCAAPGLIEGTKTSETLKSWGMGLIEIPLTRTGLNPLADLRMMLRLFRLCQQEQYDLVLAYTIKPVIWGGIAAWMARIERRVSLITGLGYAFTGEARGKRALVRRLVLGLYARSLRRATLVFFQNPDDRADFARWGLLRDVPKIVVVNGSGVDVDEFSFEPFTDGPTRFLMIARLLGDKGVREFAIAAADLRKRWPIAEFYLVGPLDSNPNGITEEEVRSWHEAGTLSWLGPVDDVRPAIANAHVYVLPSYREGTPRTVLEAMSMGRPVVTTDAPGCRETVQEGVNGFLVPVRDAVALAEAMEKFLLEPELIDRMGEQSQRIVTEKYDVRKVNAVMIDAMGL